MTLTVGDHFAGAGGSSTGMAQNPFVKIRYAANHNQLAINVHNINHPGADHACVDLHLEDPAFFPRVDIAWFSPECTKWSQGNSMPLPNIEEGLFEDPLSNDAALRSRLLMFDVLRYAEHHRYRSMIIENVVDIATQPKYRLAWTTWKKDLRKLGYKFRVVSLNSMHAQRFGDPAPQSRDRIYIVCWLEGDRAPDVDKILRPLAWCPRCAEMIESQQAWKNGRTVGRYRQQYVYVHAACGTQVEPGYLPAAAAIDWTILGTRIGERDKPLADKTRARIAAGIARYWRPFTLEAAGNTFERRPGVRTWPADAVLTTLHTTASKALAIPVEGREGVDARPMGLPFRTQTTRHETAMVTPVAGNLGHQSGPQCGEATRADVFNGVYCACERGTPGVDMRGAGPPPLHVSLMGSRTDRSARPVDSELRTVTAEGNNDYLLSPYYGRSDTARPVDQPIGTLTTHDKYALVAPAGGTWNDDARPVSDPHRAFTTREAYALIHRHNSGGAGMLTPAGEYMRTLTTGGNQSLLTPGDIAAAESQVDDCLFRMLEPHEIAAGMSFPSDYDWHSARDEKGRPASRRNLVKMAGNAVTPPAARDLIACVVEALGGEFDLGAAA